MKVRNILFLVLTLYLFFFLAIEAQSSPSRLKDICTVEGARINQLSGYGLVVGLNGTGDKSGTEFTVQSLTNLLTRQGIQVSPDDVRVQNVAAVMITAELPPFGRPGQKIDVTVSSLGDCKSLQGGTLLFTPLKGADNRVYAIAQGPVSIGGFNIETSGGSKVQKNHVTVGRIPGGAVLEDNVETSIVHDGIMRLLLNDPDYRTAQKVQDELNKNFRSEHFALATDQGTIELRPSALTTRFKSPVELMAKLENIEVDTETKAKIIINERTGTVVAGADVRISTVAISVGGISVEIDSTPQVSQAQPFAEGGKTVETKKEELTVEDKKAPFQIMQGGTVSNLVRGLNEFKLTSAEMISVFQALKEAGALNAELVIM